MWVPKEKRELYAVHFVSANTYAIVLSQICRTSHTTLYKISQIRIFSFFLPISENILIFWRGVYIMNTFRTQFWIFQEIT